VPKKTGNSPDQMSLLGFESREEPREPPLFLAWPETQPNDTLFLAILVDSATAEKIKPQRSLLIGEHKLSGKPIAAERLHVSLALLGHGLKLTNSQVEIAKQAVATVIQPSFTTCFNRTLSFPMRKGDHPLVLEANSDAAKMRLLQKTLVSALRSAKLDIQAAGFTPHITLLYDKRIIAEQAIEPIELNVREFVLIHSHVGQSRYTVLGRWPLLEQGNEAPE
jgi:2'-5' RNA ligase